MFKVLQVIPETHLATYKPVKGEDSEACTICAYKVIVRMESGEVMMMSAMDDDTLIAGYGDEYGFEYDLKNDDYWRPFNGVVGMQNIDEWVENEDDDHVLERVEMVLRFVKGSGAPCTPEVEKFFKLI